MPSTSEIAKLAPVTWQQAEDALIGALEYLSALPDRERGFLSAGSRSAWPEIIRIDANDYDESYDAALGPTQQRISIAPPQRRNLTRKEMAQLDRMLLSERCCAMAIPPHHRALVGRVLAMKLSERGGGFRWEEVWMREGGRACGVTSDALRMRYERAVGKVAVAMERGS